MVEEIFSKAQYADDPTKYKIIFREFDTLKEMSLPEFILESDNFQTIPSSRIEMIKINNTTLFEKNRK